MIFDLDETLVHCVGSDVNVKSDVRVDIVLEKSKKTLQVGFNIRPFARECLAEVGKLYEVIVFTASHKCYADPILDYLDPEGTLIQHRLYRESCIEAKKKLFVKDLRILGTNRPLSKTILVDNAIYSFGY